MEKQIMWTVRLNRPRTFSHITLAITVPAADPEKGEVDFTRDQIKEMILDAMPGWSVINASPATL